MDKEVAFLVGSHIPFNHQSVLLNTGKLIGDKVDLKIIGNSYTNYCSLEKNYDIYKYNFPSLDKRDVIYSLVTANKYLRKNNPDVLMNVGTPFPLGVAVVLAGWLHGVASLLRITGDNFYRIPLRDRELVRIRKYLVHRVFASFFYRRADHIVTVGSNLQSIAIENGTPPDRVSILPQPFDATEFSPASKNEKVALRRELGISAEKKVILFVGRLTYGKGADRLVHIIREVIKRSNEFQFCVLGSGPYEEWLERLSDETVIGPKTVPHSRISDYFRAADLFVYPTRRDGLPNTLLEGLACELPIIASPIGEIPAYVESTAEKPKTYVNYILNKDWTPDPKPEWFEWDVQRRRYLEVLSQVASQT